MSARATDWAWHVEGLRDEDVLSPLDRLALLALADDAADDGEVGVRAPVSYLERKCRVGKAEGVELIRGLARRGLVEKTPSGLRLPIAWDPECRECVDHPRRVTYCFGCGRSNLDESTNG